MRAVWIIVVVLISGFSSFLFAQEGAKSLPVKVDYKWGILDPLTGKMLLEPQYDNFIFTPRPDLIIMEAEGKKGVIRNDGKIIIPPKFPEITLEKGKYFHVKSENKWGAYSTDGRMIFPAEYENIIYPKGRNLFLKSGGKYAIGNDRGKIFSPAIFDTLNAFGDFTLAKTGDSLRLFNSRGKIIIPTGYDKISQSEYHYFEVVENGRSGIFDSSGNQIIPTEYDRVEYFSSGFLRLYRNGRQSIYCVKGKRFFPGNINLQFFDNQNFVKFTNDSGVGLISLAGKRILPPLYSMVTYSSDMFYISTGKLWGLADTSGKIIISPQYDQISNFSGSVAYMRIKNSWGLINRSGTTLLPAGFEKIKIYRNSAKAYKGDTLHIVNLDNGGNVTDHVTYSNVRTIKVIKGQMGYSPVLRTNRASTTGWFYDNRSGLWGLRDTQGVVRIQPQFTAIERIPGLNLTIVENISPSDLFRVGNVKVEPIKKYGIVNDTLYRIVTPLKYLHIFREDFNKGRGISARCVRLNGSYSLLFKTGHILPKSFAYIDTFNNGFARAYFSGEITIATENEKVEKVISCVSYFNPIMNSIDPIFNSSFTRKFYEDPSTIITCGKGRWTLLNEFGNYSLDSTYDHIRDVSDSLAIVKKNQRWGVINVNREIIIPFRYDDISRMEGPTKDLFRLYEKKKRYGYLDRDGKILVETIYNRGWDYSEGLAKVKSIDGYSFLDQNGIPLNEMPLDDAKSFSEGFAPVKSKGKWGYIDQKGNFIIPPGFSETFPFSEGLAKVKIKFSYGFINKKGEVVIPVKYNDATDFRNGIAWVKKRGKYFAINSQGEKITQKKYSKLVYFSPNGLSIASRGKGSGVINASGEEITPFNFTNIRPFKEGIAIARKGGKFALIDTSGNSILLNFPFKILDFSDSMAAFLQKGKWGYLNRQGEIVVKPNLRKAEPFHEGLAYAQTNENEGFINKTGKFLFPVRGNYSEPFQNGRGILRYPELGYFFINQSGSLLYNKYFQDIGQRDPRYTAVKVNKKWGLVDDRGSIFKPVFDEIDPFREGMARIRIDHYYGIASAEGKILAGCEYEIIEKFNDQILRLRKNDQLGYLSLSGSWLWEPKK